MQCPRCGDRTAITPQLDGHTMKCCGHWIPGELQPLRFDHTTLKRLPASEKVPRGPGMYSIVERRTACLMFIEKHFEAIRRLLEVDKYTWQQLDQHYGNRTTLMDISTFRKYYREEYSRQFGVSVEDQKLSGGNSKFSSYAAKKKRERGV